MGRYDYDTQILIYGTIENLSVFKTNFDLGWENVFNKKLISKSEGVTKFLNKQGNIIISQRFEFKEWMNFLDEFDIKSIDESEKLCLYFAATTEVTPTVRFYQLLAALYPNLRFEIDIQRIQFFEIEEYHFENGRITKHIHEYIDDSEENNMKICREDFINNTFQVVDEQVWDETEENSDAQETRRKKQSASTTEDFDMLMENDDLLEALDNM